MIVRYLRATDFAPANPTRQWQAYIKAKIEKAEQRMIRICMSAVGETLIEERNKSRAEFEVALAREVAALRNEFLADRLDAERGVRRTFP